nr:immunoglobulin light chain junction region [Macaca mulatta]MOX17533.1 immunoglobulin light chain junction region [Macaca mulatta]MOX20170.1 immunoglobulin light chain junction region [Macaca mulatta]
DYYCQAYDSGANLVF